jgi:hypothetical protein
MREYVAEPMVEKSVPIEKGRRRRAASVGGRVVVKKKIKKIGAGARVRGGREK